MTCIVENSEFSVGLRGLLAPRPEEFEALGPVLCIRSGAFARDAVHLAHRLHYVAAVDIDVVRESLGCRDARHRSSWQIFLLPDSDARTWRRLSARAQHAERRHRGNAAVPQWLSCVHAWSSPPRRRARVVRLSVPAMADASNARPLFLSLVDVAQLSPLGAEVVDSILRAEHAELG